METSARISWRHALAVAFVSLLVGIPALALAQQQVPSGTRIFNSVIQRLCQAQQARGNRIILVDPARCASFASPTLTLVKTVINDNGGTASSTSFQVRIDGTLVAWGTPQTVSVGTHTASEVTHSNYSASAWGGDCAANGSITLAVGENKTCTITNDDIPPTPETGHLVVIKDVVGGTSTASAFTLRSVSGNSTSTFSGSSSGTSLTYDAGSSYTVTEVDTPSDYTASFSAGCTGAILANSTTTCTVTNTFNATSSAPTLTVMKVVVNDNGGIATTTDFTLFIDGATTTSGVAVTITAGAHVVSEGAHVGYTSSVSGDCDENGNVTLAPGENKTCTITNNDNAPAPTGQLLITEVLYDLTTSTTSPQGDEPANEWVEIHNGTNANIDLSGYFIHDATGADALPSVILPAGKFALITGSSTTATFWSIPVDAMWIVLANATIGSGLTNTGDTVWLEDTASTTVDAVSWGTDTSAFNPSVPTVPPNSGNSIARTSITTDTNTVADWVEDTTPTPGS